jgi:hypothetical protein
MKFVQDFKIKENKKIDDELKLNIKASFYLAYLDQICDKLDFSMKEVETEEDDKKIKVIRCSMEMIKPPSKLTIDRTKTRNKGSHEEKITNREEDYIKNIEKETKKETKKEIKKEGV